MSEMPASREKRRRPALRLVDGAPAGEPRPGSRVVAMILSDGSVREVEGGRLTQQPGAGWASGSVAGDDWVLWWERRSFD
jgi:hypothetical protein